MAFLCEICGIIFSRKYNLKLHQSNDHNLKSGVGLKKALNKSLSCFSFSPEESEKFDPLVFFKRQKLNIYGLLNSLIPIKWSSSLTCLFFKKTTANEIVFNEAVFTFPTQLSLIKKELIQQILQSTSFFLDTIETFTNLGSGWIFDHIVRLDIKVGKYSPLVGSSYIPTPQKIANPAHKILNIRNTDNKCFLWCIVAKLHPRATTGHPERVSHYRPFENELNFKGIKFPVSIQDIEKFEKLNNISVNVFGYDRELFPIRISRLKLSLDHVDLLYLTRDNISHYCLIRDFNSLNGAITKHVGRKFFCRFCIQHFNFECVLNKHLEICSEQKCQKISMPQSGEMVNFKEVRYMVPMPFSIFFDFESMLVPENDEPGIVSKHEPCAYCFVILDVYGNLFELDGKKIFFYRGFDPVTHFLESILEVEKKLMMLINSKKDLVMTPKDEMRFQQQTHCSVCHEIFTERDSKCRDHCHTTGKYRTAMHTVCNAAYRTPTFIPVIGHNIKLYDTHLIMQKLGNFKHVKVSCIAQNFERYISFSVNNLRFTDSLLFLSASLATLVDTLVKSNWDFPLMNQLENDKNRLALLLRKGIFCYEYLDGWEKMEEVELPAKEKFFSALTQEEISDSDYLHAQKVWNAYNLKTLGDYLDLYLITDVILLCEVMNNFRKTCFSSYELEPLHFVSTPSLTWTAFLKFTNVSVELFSDPDMHLFIEKGIRGGISSVGDLRFAQANDPRCKKYYDPLKSTCSILYFDKTNLYGGALSDYHAIGNFRFLGEEEVKQFDVLSIPAHGQSTLR